MKSHILEQLDNTSKCYPGSSKPEGIIRKTYTVKYVYYIIT